MSASVLFMSMSLDLVGGRLARPEFREQRLSLRPVTKSAARVDVTGRPDLDEPASPGAGAAARMVDAPVWVVAAGDDDARKSEPLERQGREPNRFFARKSGAFGVGNGHQQCASNAAARRCGPVRQLQARQAVRHQHDVRLATAYSGFQRCDPHAAHGVIPVLLLHPPRAGKQFLPVSLPMPIARIAYATIFTSSVNNKEQCLVFISPGNSPGERFIARDSFIFLLPGFSSINRFINSLSKCTGI